MDKKDKKKKRQKGHNKEDKKNKYEGPTSFGALTNKFYKGQEHTADVTIPFDSNDSEINIILKKLTKKAMETKIKGFQELITKIATLTEEKKQGLCQYYSYIFKSTIEYEHERKIRELLFIALSSLAQYMEPYLKDIFSHLYISFFDVVEVSTKAQDLFNKYAPPNFFKTVADDFLSYVNDKLSSEYSQFSNDLGSLEDSLKQEIYERTLSTTLYALANSFSLYHDNEYLELVSKRLSLDDPKSVIFTYLGQKSKGKIKTAALECISTLLKEYPSQKFEIHLGEISSTVVNSINEPNMLYQQTLWSKIMLNMITGYEKVWEVVNIRKHFLNRLYQCIRKGAYGAAISLYNNLMQILSKFSFIKFEDKQLEQEEKMQCYEQIFDNLLKGFESEEAAPYHKELLKCYYDCALFVILKRFVGPNRNIELIQKVLSAPFCIYQKEEAAFSLRTAKYSLVEIYKNFLEQLKSRSNDDFVIADKCLSEQVSLIFNSSWTEEKLDYLIIFLNELKNERLNTIFTECGSTIYAYFSKSLVAKAKGKIQLDENSIDMYILYLLHKISLFPSAHTTINIAEIPHIKLINDCKLLQEDDDALYNKYKIAFLLYVIDASPESLYSIGLENLKYDKEILHFQVNPTFFISQLVCQYYKKRQNEIRKLNERLNSIIAPLLENPLYAQKFTTVLDIDKAHTNYITNIIEHMANLPSKSLFLQVASVIIKEYNEELITKCIIEKLPKLEQSVTNSLIPVTIKTIYTKEIEFGGSSLWQLMMKPDIELIEKEIIQYVLKPEEPIIGFFENLSIFAEKKGIVPIKFLSKLLFHNKAILTSCDNVRLFAKILLKPGIGFNMNSILENDDQLLWIITGIIKSPYIPYPSNLIKIRDQLILTNHTIIYPYLISILNTPQMNAILEKLISEDIISTQSICSIFAFFFENAVDKSLIISELHSKVAIQIFDKYILSKMDYNHFRSLQIIINSILSNKQILPPQIVEYAKNSDKHDYQKMCISLLLNANQDMLSSIDSIDDGIYKSELLLILRNAKPISIEVLKSHIKKSINLLEKETDVSYAGFDTFSNLIFSLVDKPRAEELGLFDVIIERILEFTYHKCEDYASHADISPKLLGMYNTLFYRLEFFYNKYIIT